MRICMYCIYLCVQVSWYKQVSFVLVCSETLQDKYITTRDISEIHTQVSYILPGSYYTAYITALSIQGRQWRGGGGGGGGRGDNCPTRFCQNIRRHRASAVRRITTCPPSFRKQLTPLAHHMILRHNRAKVVIKPHYQFSALMLGILQEISGL